MIYTIGHSNRKLRDFISLLKYYEIKNLIDVRRFPYSKKFEWFNRENLLKALKEENISYYWLGKELGGFRKEGYEAYMLKDHYKFGLKKVMDLSDKKTCIMCAEKLFFKCHRKFISQSLVELSFKVIHIIDENKIYEMK
ncbi:MAG: DUF488 domain-containing protein [Candidatus Hydrothermales bacterium]